MAEENITVDDISGMMILRDYYCRIDIEDVCYSSIYNSTIDWYTNNLWQDKRYSTIVFQFVDEALAFQILIYIQNAIEWACAQISGKNSWSFYKLGLIILHYPLYFHYDTQIMLNKEWIGNVSRCIVPHDCKKYINGIQDQTLILQTSTEDRIVTERVIAPTRWIFTN